MLGFPWLAHTTMRTDWHGGWKDNSTDGQVLCIIQCMHLCARQMERMILLMVSVQEVAGSSIVGMVTAGATLTTMGSMLTLTAFLFAPITQCHISDIFLSCSSCR